MLQHSAYSFFTFFFEATLYYCIGIYDDFLTFFFDPSWQRIAQNSAKISNIFYMRVRVKKDVDGKFDDENECSEEKDFKVVVSCGSSGVFGLAKVLTEGP